MASSASSLGPLQTDVLFSGHASFSPSISTTPPQSLLETEGIPLETFIDELDQQFRCILCKKGLRWAMQAGCGCRSCYGCQYRFNKDLGEELTCPHCGEAFLKQEIVKDNFARKKLEKWKVYCANRARGCREQMLLKMMDKHLQQECDYEVISCMYHSKGCLKRVQRNQLVQHLEKECAFRRQKCGYCGDEIIVNELELHEKECKKFLDTCPNKCGEELIHKEKMQEHITKTCPLEVIRCFFTPFGCSYKEERRTRKMDSHMSEYQVYHLQIVTEHIKNMDLVLNELRLFKDQGKKMATEGMTEKMQGLEISGGLKQSLAKFEKQIRDLQKMIAPRVEQIDSLEDNINKLAKQETVMEIQKSLKPIEEDQTAMKSRILALEQRQKPGSSDSNITGETSVTMTGVTTSALSASSSRLTTMENQMGMHAVRIAEHDLRFQVLETASHDGTLLWKIKDFARRKRDADIGKTLSLYSQPFYTSRYGYKMCARIYLNGDGMGKGTHVSLFFVVMRGDCDALLPWPFRQKVTLMLLDQDTGRRHLSDSFRPDPASSSFGRPTTEMNIASGCPLFVSQSVLSDPAYVKDNVMFIKVIVDVSDVVKP